LLLGGFKHVLLSIIYGIILPIDELIFFRGVETTNQIGLLVCWDFPWFLTPSGTTKPQFYDHKPSKVRG
jgi:hypothetical protein